MNIGRIEKRTGERMVKSKIEGEGEGERERASSFV